MFILVAAQAVPLDTSSITGIVQRSGTAELLDLAVVSLIPAGGAAAPPSVETDSTGRFSLRNVPPGRYAISVRREGYFGPLRHGASAPFVTRQITLTGSNITAVRNVEFRIKDSPRPIGIASATAGTESFSIQHVPAGEYDVSVTMAPGTSVADIQQAGRSVLKEGIVVGEEPSEPLRLILDSAKPK